MAACLIGAFFHGIVIAIISHTVDAIVRYTGRRRRSRVVVRRRELFATVVGASLALMMRRLIVTVNHRIILLHILGTVWQLLLSNYTIRGSIY